MHPRHPGSQAGRPTMAASVRAAASAAQVRPREAHLGTSAVGISGPLTGHMYTCGHTPHPEHSDCFVQTLIPSRTVRSLLKRPPCTITRPARRHWSV